MKAGLCWFFFCSGVSGIELHKSWSRLLALLKACALQVVKSEKMFEGIFQNILQIMFFAKIV